MDLLTTYFGEILIQIQTFSFIKIHLKLSSAKWQPFCSGGGGRWVNRYWGMDYLFPWQNRSYDQLSLCVKFDSMPGGFQMQDYSPSFADSAYSVQWYFIDDRWTAHIYIFVSGTKCSCFRHKIIINGICTLVWWWDLPSITKLMEFWLKINFQCIPYICFLAIHWLLVKHSTSMN